MSTEYSRTVRCSASRTKRINRSGRAAAERIAPHRLLPHPRRPSPDHPHDRRALSACSLSRSSRWDSGRSRFRRPRWRRRLRFAPHEADRPFPVREVSLAPQSTAASTRQSSFAVPLICLAAAAVGADRRIGTRAPGASLPRPGRSSFESGADTATCVIVPGTRAQVDALAARHGLSIRKRLEDRRASSRYRPAPWPPLAADAGRRLPHQQLSAAAAHGGDDGRDWRRPGVVGRLGGGRPRPHRQRHRRGGDRFGRRRGAGAQEPNRRQRGLHRLVRRVRPGGGPRRLRRRRDGGARARWATTTATARTWRGSSRPPGSTRRTPPAAWRPAHTSSI